MRAFDRHCNMVLENVREMWTEVCFHLYWRTTCHVDIGKFHFVLNKDTLCRYRRLGKARRKHIPLTKIDLSVRCFFVGILLLLFLGIPSDVKKTCCICSTLDRENIWVGRMNFVPSMSIQLLYTDVEFGFSKGLFDIVWLRRAKCWVVSVILVFKPLYHSQSWQYWQWLISRVTIILCKALVTIMIVQGC